MLKKIWSIAALLSSAAALNACQTSAGKPVNCLPAFEMKGRCAKVPQSVKDEHRTVLDTTKAKPKKKVVAKAPPSSILDQRVQPPRQNVYGVPQ